MSSDSRFITEPVLSILGPVTKEDSLERGQRTETSQPARARGVVPALALARGHEPAGAGNSGRRGKGDPVRPPVRPSVHPSIHPSIHPPYTRYCGMNHMLCYNILSYDIISRMLAANLLDTPHHSSSDNQQRRHWSDNRIQHDRLP